MPRKEKTEKPAQGRIRASDPALADRVATVVEMFATKREAARVVGKSEDMLARYTKAQGEPPIAVIATLAKSKGVSLHWLATGEGDMHDGGSAREVSAQDLGSQGYTLVPRYDVQAAAGDGVIVSQERLIDHLAFRADWIRRLGSAPADLICIEAVGHSMEPTIRDGDLLLVNRTVSRIDADAIYALVFGDALVVKRVRLEFDGGVTILSDAKEYSPQHVPAARASEIRVVGKVLWHGGPV